MSTVKLAISPGGVASFSELFDARKFGTNAKKSSFPVHFSMLYRIFKYVLFSFQITNSNKNFNN
jgi:hypothetical protein